MSMYGLLVQGENYLPVDVDVSVMDMDPFLVT